MSGHAATLMNNGGRYNHVFATESFNESMSAVLENVGLSHSADLQDLPRFNESEGHGPKRAHAVEDYFDDLAVHIMNDIYRKDISIFKYRRQPGQDAPREALDPDEINAKLAR